jgi:hypothetical protein
MTITARYERNHIRLGWFHIGLAVFWTVRLGIDFLIAYSRIPRELWIKVMIVALGTVTLHSALAWGAMVKAEPSRKISVFVGAAMFMGAVVWQSFDSTYFPFSAYVALFMLTLTQWKAAYEPTLDRTDFPETASTRGPLQRLWLVLAILVAAGIAVAKYYEKQFGPVWGPAAGMGLIILFLALVSLWPGKLQPEHPPA